MKNESNEDRKSWTEIIKIKRNKQSKDSDKQSKEISANYPSPTNEDLKYDDGNETGLFI